MKIYSSLLFLSSVYYMNNNNNNSARIHIAQVSASNGETIK